MKIDILVYSLRGGGAERVAANLADGWHEAGHSVRIITHESLHTIEYRPLPGVELVSCASPDGKPARGPGRLMRLRRVLAHRHADVVVAVQGNVAIEAVLASTRLGLRIVGCEHSTPTRAVQGRLWRFLRPFAYRRLAAIVSLTAGAADELRQLCPGSNIVVIPNALRLPLPEKTPRVDPVLLLPLKTHCLLAAGRMVEAKGFDHLIANFATLASRRSDVCLVILGEGPLYSQLSRQVDDLGLQGRVLLPGRSGNIMEWYLRASVYLMTSRWEGLPMVLLEAMGHGVPVVSTDFSYGPRDVIRNGIDGFIVPEGDSDVWCDTVVSLLEDNDRRRSLGARAREVISRFSEGRVLALWDELFAGLGVPGSFGGGGAIDDLRAGSSDEVR